MRILHVLNNLEREGAQAVVHHLATHGSAAVHARVCAWRRGGPLAAKLEAARVPVFVPASRARAPWTTYRFLASLVRRERIDVIHGHMSDGAAWGALAAARFGLPLVVTYHSTRAIPPAVERDSLYGRLRLAAVRLAARRAAANVACAAEVAAPIASELGLATERLQVIANGIPFPPAADVAAAGERRCARAGRGWGEGPRIVTVGRLVPVKGQDLVVAAASDVLARHPRASFVLIGEGPSADALRLEVERRGLGDRVSFTGAVDDPSLWLRDADLYVASSRREGLSVALLEALGWGLPAVASDVGGNRGVIDDGRTGRLFAAGDAGALARAVLDALAKPGESEAMAARAREDSRARFGAERMASEYEAVYRSCLPQRVPAQTSAR